MAAKETGAGAPEGTPEHMELVERLDVAADPARVSAPTPVISPVDDPLQPAPAPPRGRGRDTGPG
ncbi:hypothetical protein [Streptomyces sp. NPDC054783]